jgi:nicotinate-nucleotide pyrophosphorylase (carboxylating)
VHTGGGWNHRIDLSDMAMIKDNHVAKAGSMKLAIAKIREKFPKKKVELEIDRIDQIEEALASKPDILLLDNFSLEDTKLAVEKIHTSSPDMWIECSGGITPSKLQALNEIGKIGVSMGYLTHTTRFCDLSIEVIS